MFIITTDGMENSSHEYTYQQVKQMVERQQESFDWEFLFLGANMDAVKTAGSFGIRKDRAVTYECDEKGTALNYEVLGEAIQQVRATGCLVPEWKRKIEVDHQRRHR